MKRLLLVVTTALALTGCVGITDEQACAAKGIEQQSSEYWQCMNYAQSERAIKEQRKAANAAIFGAVKPRVCNSYGGSVQCW